MRAAAAIVALAALTATVVSVRVQTPAPIKNTKIGPLEGSRPAFEPSIVVSRKDPNIIVGGICMNAAAFTKDGGKTWGETLLTSQHGVAGDAAMATDSDGNFYYIHLSNGKQPNGWLDCIVSQKSTDGGRTWSDGAQIGYNHPADQDKAWPTTHPTKPWVYVTWTQFDTYGSNDPTKRSNIMFSGSTDGGATFSEETRINQYSGDCLDGDNTTEGAVPAVDKEGRIFVAWAWGESIWLDRSYDGGKTWLPKDIDVTPIVGGWNMSIPGIGRANGMPVLMVDNSDGPNAGTLYILWADQRFGAADTDVFIVSSKNQGDTWSKPLRVNKDGAGKQQFFPWLAVDATTGNVYAVYYDRRAHTDNQTDVFVAFSTDGGKTFMERKVSEKPFFPTTGAFFGDYNNISAHGGVVAAIWTRMDNRVTTVWTAVMKHAELVATR